MRLEQSSGEKTERGRETERGGVEINKKRQEERSEVGVKREGERD